MESLLLLLNRFVLNGLLGDAWKFQQIGSWKKDTQHLGLTPV